MTTQIAILSFSSIARDARVLRQVKYLSRHYAVEVLGYGAAAGVPRFAPMLLTANRLAYKARKLLFLSLGRVSQRAYEAWYWGVPEYRLALKHLIRSHAQVIHANDLLALPTAVKAAQIIGARVVLDLHEYAPLEMENRAGWKTFWQPMADYFLRRYAPAVAASVTVNQPIADRYAREYGLMPIVVMNAPEPTPPPVFRPTKAEQIQLIHHGGANHDRKLELMIETIARADARFTLHFMLISDQGRYIRQLKRLAESITPGRVMFHAPVAPEAIVPRIAAYDIGFFLLEPCNFNYLMALPNKFFDFLMAGLAVCVGPSPVMAELTRRYQAGCVAPGFSPAEVAQTLNALTVDQINQMRQAARQAARHLNADIEMGKLTDLYARFFDRMA